VKKSLILCGLIVLNLAGAARAAIELDATSAANTAVPDGNPVGITSSLTLSGPFVGVVTAVNVDLDITGGYNGDLYGYLEYQDVNSSTATEILLNRIGTSASDSFGSSGSGFNNIELSDSGTVNGSIHGAAGIPTGTWLADSAYSLNGTFGGMAAQGTWTLFLADMSVGGGTSTLESWGLDIIAVPEPSQAGLVLAAGALLAAVWGTRIGVGRRKLQPARV